LNLNTSEGVAVLYRRIKSAAIEVCGPPDPWDRAQRREACINSALSRGVGQVNSPMLTSLYNAKAGKPVITLAKSH
jgi:UrcA family protein